VRNTGTESSGSRVALHGRLWDQSRATVVYYRGEKRGVERTAQRLFRRPLDSSELAALAGAPDEAEVEVGTLDAGLYLEMYQPVMNGYHAVQLVRPSGGGPVVTIALLS